MSDEAGFRCKKCRRTLFSSSHMVSSHGDPWSGHVAFSCPVNKVDTVWYVRDEKLPDWLLEQLDSGEWVKGKLYCPECNARLGSFDFVTGTKCDCEEFVLPPIHISKSRIDCDHTHKMASILQHIVKPPVAQSVANSSELSAS